DISCAAASTDELGVFARGTRESRERTLSRDVQLPRAPNTLENRSRIRRTCGAVLPVQPSRAGSRPFRARTGRNSMDVPRQPKKRPRALIWGGGALVLALMTWGATLLKPAAPTIERASVMIDTVQRGEMRREVRAIGTLVPEDQRLVPALTA